MATVQGPAGPAGPKGPRGDQGPQGPVGPQGLKGAPGPSGGPGPRGVPGPQGTRGAPGLDGSRGLQGDKGDKGDKGLDVPDATAADIGKFLVLSDDDPVAFEWAAIAASTPPTRQILAGSGLTGGGDLSADRAFALTNTGVTPGDYSNADISVDQKGRITAAATPHTERGHSVITVGVGDTHEYLDVAWATPFGAALGASGYRVTVDIICTNGDVVGWSRSNNTTTGFRINFSADFDGEVHWKVEP